MWMSLAIIVVLGGLIGAGLGFRAVSAQDDSAPSLADHPIVGTWVVDTISASDTDSPEIGMFLADDRAVGQGVNRAAGGRWEVIDAQTVMMTLVTVSDSGGEGSYVLVRGPHTVDASGDAWTCACTFTLVAADGTVLDSGDAPANARRLPLQGPEAVGTALEEVPVWTPVMPDAATPAT